MLEIIYQDKYLVAINKPSGLLVHRSPIDRHETRFAIQELRNQIGQYVYPVHRLDKPTSGVLLFALDKDTAKIMSAQFGLSDIQKTYVAIVRGYINDRGIIEHALTQKYDKIADKDSSNEKEPQDARTEYERLETVEIPYAVGRYEKTRYSLVKLMPKTGRKHQLRRHMKHINHHILGDTKYGRGEHNILVRKIYDCHRMMLHAKSLEIKHPINAKTLKLEASYDDTFKSIFNYFEWKI